MKNLIKVMLGMYAIVFVLAIFSIMGCNKYHGASSDSPKGKKMDVSMNNLPEKNIVDGPPIKIHVTFFR